MVTGSFPEAIARTKNDFRSCFEMTDSDMCAFILGIEQTDDSESILTMCQRRQINDISESFYMDVCKAAVGPVDLSHLSKAATKTNAPFRKEVGMLIRRTTAMRPDIASAVGYVSRLMKMFQEERKIAFQRTLL